MADYAIVGVDVGLNKFVIAGDIAPAIPPGVDVPDVLYPNRWLTIHSSTGNDGTYTVVSAVFVNPNTEVVVLEPIPSNVVDGQLRPLAPSPYVINLTDGTALLSVDPGTQDISTDLKLPGPDYPNYGEPMVENLVHLLENFSNDNVSPPPQPVQGQLWYDRTNNVLQVCSDVVGPVWNIVNSAYVNSLYVELAGDTMTGPLIVNTDNVDMLTLHRDNVAESFMVFTDNTIGSAGWETGKAAGGNFHIGNRNTSTTSLRIDGVTDDVTLAARLFLAGNTGVSNDPTGTLIVDTYNATSNVVQIKIPTNGTGSLTFGESTFTNKASFEYNSATDAFAFSTNVGSDIIHQNGRIGLDGTTAPISPIDIGGYLLIGEGAGSVTTGPDVRFQASGLTSSGSNMHINFSGDGNPAVRQLVFASGAHNSTATTHLTLSSEGNVGLGFAAPSAYRLHVRDDTGATTSTLLETTAGESMVRFSDAATTTPPAVGSNGNSLHFHTLGTPSVVIADAGSVGIGTQVPQSDLHIHTTSPGAPTTFRMTNDATGLSTLDGVLFEYQSGGNLVIDDKDGFEIQFRIQGNNIMAVRLTDIVTTAELIINGGLTVNPGLVDFGSNTLTNVANPINTADAVTLGYADGKYFPYTGGIVTGNLTVNGTTTDEDLFVNQNIRLGASTDANDHVLTINASSNNTAGVYVDVPFGGASVLRVSEGNVTGGGLVYVGNNATTGGWDFSNIPNDRLVLFKTYLGVHQPILWNAPIGLDIETSGNLAIGTGLVESNVNVNRSSVPSKLLAAADLVVVTGEVAHTATIPLPPGFTEAQCRWMVTLNNTLSDTNGGLDGWQIAQTTRTITARYKNENGSSWNNMPAMRYILIGVK